MHGGVTLLIRSIRPRTYGRAAISKFINENEDGAIYTTRDSSACMITPVGMIGSRGAWDRLIPAAIPANRFLSSSQSFTSHGGAS